MLISRNAVRGVSIACGLGALLLAMQPASAIDDPKAPPSMTNPPPAEGPLVGRPETAGAQALAPVPNPPLVTPEDQLPVKKIKVPKGFKVEVFASGIKDARTMRVGNNGAVFVANWEGNKIWVVTEKGGKREAKVLYEGLDWPNGIALHKGTLYIAENSKISKAENIEANLDNPPKLVTIYDKLSTEKPHGWRFLGVGPD